MKDDSNNNFYQGGRGSVVSVVTTLRAWWSGRRVPVG